MPLPCPAQIVCCCTSAWQQDVFLHIISDMPSLSSSCQAPHTRAESREQQCILAQYIVGVDCGRDIKPENIFLTGAMKFKLGDFGLAIKANEEQPFTRSGTLDYMAPEAGFWLPCSAPPRRQGCALRAMQH